MDVFGVYVFQEQARVDNGKGNLVIVVPITPDWVDRYGVPIPGYTRMLYVASSIFSYNIETEEYKVLKCRSMDYVPQSTTADSFYEITQAESLIYMNTDIGDEGCITTFLHNTRAPGIVSDKKYCKISLDGIERPELYLTALIGVDQEE